MGPPGGHAGGGALEQTAWKVAQANYAGRLAPAERLGTGIGFVLDERARHVHSRAGDVTPIDRIGAMSFEEFLPEKDRVSLSQQLNTLLASSTFPCVTWMKATLQRAWASVTTLPKAPRLSS